VNEVFVVARDVQKKVGGKKKEDVEIGSHFHGIPPNKIEADAWTLGEF
jgi:hypothetical protein